MHLSLQGKKEKATLVGLDARWFHGDALICPSYIPTHFHATSPNTVH